MSFADIMRVILMRWWNSSVAAGKCLSALKVHGHQRLFNQAVSRHNVFCSDAVPSSPHPPDPCLLVLVSSLLWHRT